MLSRRRAWTVAIVATLTMTVSYIDRSSLAVLGDSVSKALGINNTEFGWLASAFSIAYMFSTPLAGWWIDHVGARRGLVRSVLVWTAIAASHALVPGFGVMFAMRIALGFAEGPSFPGAAQTIQRILPAEDQARGFGILFTGSSIGGMLVPPLASWLFNIGGWRFAFLGTALAGLVWVPAWILVTRHPEVRARLDAHRLASAEVARRSVRERLSAYVDRNMIRAWLPVLAAAPIAGFGLTWAAKFLARTFDVKQGDVGHYLWLSPLLFDLGAITFGDLASRRRARGNTTPPRLLFVVAMVLATTILGLRFVGGPWETVLVIGVAMMGSGAIYTLLTADLLSRVPPDAVSFAGGTVAAAQSLILIIANPLIGASVDATGSYDVAATVLAVWTVPGCIAWILMKPRPTPT